MAFSVVQFLGLLVGTVTVLQANPGSDWFKIRERVHVHVPTEGEESCTSRIFNVLKLAVAYSELEPRVSAVIRELRPVYIEPTMSSEISSILTSARDLKVRYLLGTEFSHRVPVIEWVMTELREASPERRPVVLESLIRKFSTDCQHLVTGRELSAIMDFLSRAERVFVYDIEYMAKRLPNPDITSALRTGCEGVTSAMTWVVRLMTTEFMKPVEIVRMWESTRQATVAQGSYHQRSYQRTVEPELTRVISSQIFMRKDAFMSRQSSAVSREIHITYPERVDARCYEQKMATYKLVLLKCLLQVDTFGLNEVFAKVLKEQEMWHILKEPQIKEMAAKLAIVTRKAMTPIHTRLNDIVTNPTVRFVLDEMKQSHETLMSILSDPTNLQVTSLKSTLNSMLARIMSSEKLCRVDIGIIQRNMTALIKHIHSFMTTSTIEGIMKPVLKQYLDTSSTAKLLSAFTAQYTEFVRLHETLITSLSEDSNPSSIRPEALIVRLCRFRSSVVHIPIALLTGSELLVEALRHVGVRPETPMFMVPAHLLRELLLGITTRLTPTSVPCARLAAVKTAAGFARTILSRMIIQEESFIKMFTERALPGRLQVSEMKAVVSEIHKLLHARLERMFTDQDILGAERIASAISTLKVEDYKKPIHEVLAPLAEETRRLISSMEKRCGERVEDIQQKTVMVLITSLKSCLTDNELETHLRKKISDRPKMQMIIKVVRPVLSEITGSMLEELELMKTYLMDVNIVNFRLVFSDLIVRMLAESSPFPIQHLMIARYPTASPLDMVTKPSTLKWIHKFTTRLYETLESNSAHVSIGTLDAVVRNVVEKFDKLEYPMRKSNMLPFTVDSDISKSLSLMGEVTLEKATPSIIRHVISLSIRDLEESLPAECLWAARAKLSAALVRVLMERHLMTSSPESVIFETVFTSLRKSLPSLENVQSVTKILSSALEMSVKEAMAGLPNISGDESTHKLVSEVLVMPYRHLEGLTLRELLIDPLRKLHTYYKGCKTCPNVHMNSLIRELDTFYDRLTSTKLTATQISGLLRPVISEESLLREVSSKISNVVLPEMRHHVIAELIYTKNALEGNYPAVFRRLMGRMLVDSFGLASSSRLYGIAENPLFQVFTMEMRKELLTELTKLRVEPQMAERLINRAWTICVEESIPRVEEPRIDIDIA